MNYTKAELEQFVFDFHEMELRYNVLNQDFKEILLGNNCEATDEDITDNIIELMNDIYKASLYMQNANDISRFANKKLIKEMGLYIATANKLIKVVGEEKNIENDPICGVRALKTLSLRYLEIIAEKELKKETMKPEEQIQIDRQKTTNTKGNRGRGRQKESFADKMIDGNKERLDKIHKLMNGKKGKDAALIISACIIKGWITKPTYTQVKEEFGDIGTQQGFTKYLNNANTLYAPEEIEAILEQLKE